MIDLHIPPVAVMIIGAVIVPFLPRILRSIFTVLIPAATLAVILVVPTGSDPITLRLMDYTLVLSRIDPLSRIFGIIFAFICTIGGFYAYHLSDRWQQTAALLYAGSAIGVTFAGDYFTLFICWEMMAVASTILIWRAAGEESARAGFRYLLFHVFGGGLLFSGIILQVQGSGSFVITSLAGGHSTGSWLILLGVLVNAAVPPLHAWLTDAYPKATITGAVFLSAFTTKTAVYVLARLFPGWPILLVLGVIMTLYGVIYAILANDIRTILAYHIVSQVGFMVAGVGIGTEMAINGATAHAFSHILYTALLFMGAGAVLQATGKRRLTDLGGLYKKLPVVFWLYLIAAFSISGFPLFNGFISKSMTVAAAGEAHHPWAMLLMNLAAVGTFLSVGLKLPYFTWFGKEPHSDEKVEPLPLTMYFGMGLAAAVCVLHGLFPQLLYRLLPFEVHWNPFTRHHLVEAVQMLTITFIIFWTVRWRWLKPKKAVALDVDWLYRRPASFIRRWTVELVDDLFEGVERFGLKSAHWLTEQVKNPYFWRMAKPGRPVEYTPDKYRPASSQLILTLLGLFVLVMILSLLIRG